MLRWAAFLLAVTALGCASRTPTLEELEKMAISPKSFDRERAVILMTSDYRDDYFEELVACARDLDVSVRRAVYRRIHETRERQFIGPLQEILNSASDLEDRKLILEALARLRALPETTKTPESAR